MTVNTAKDYRECGSGLRRCYRLLRAYEKGILEFDDMAYNYFLEIAAHPAHCTESFAALIPNSLLRDFCAYCERVLQPVDFVPCPAPLLSGNMAESEVEEKKRSLRPKYRAAFELIRTRSELYPRPSFPMS